MSSAQSLAPLFAEHRTSVQVATLRGGRRSPGVRPRRGHDATPRPARLIMGIRPFARIRPWPSALLIRWAFDRGGRRADAALALHVPAGVTSLLDERYDGAGTSSGHEYPLDLDRPEGRLVLERAVAFLRRVSGPSTARTGPR